MLNNSKSKPITKKDTMYTDYIKKKESEKFAIKENIIPSDLRTRLINTLQKNIVKENSSTY